MYALIEAKRSVRKLYTESLVRRGDITLEEAEQALDGFSARLQSALYETRAAVETASDAKPALPKYVQPNIQIPTIETGIDTSTSLALAHAAHSTPAGYVIHP